MATKAMLHEIRDNCETLVLLDGRRFTINPSDTSVVVGWTPTAPLTLSKNKNAMFNITVKNEASGQSIAAMEIPAGSPKPTKARQAMKRKR